jgi:PAS domain S-box-containing protein
MQSVNDINSLPEQPAASAGIAGIAGLKVNFRKYAALTVPVFLFIILFTYFAISEDFRQNFVFEPKYLLPILNFIFLGLSSLVVSFLAAKSYLKTGRLNLALLGSGALSLGLGGITAGFFIHLPGGPNINVTISNCSALLSGFLHFSCSIADILDLSSEKNAERKNSILFGIYSMVLVVLSLIIAATLLNWMPVFFVQGTGPTMTRQFVLNTSILLMLVSGIYLYSLFTKTRNDFLYWYALGLILIAEGLLALMLQRNVGSIIGWTGRMAQYTGGVFLLIAVYTIFKERPISDLLAEVFKKTEKLYASMFENSVDGIFVSVHNGTVLKVNPAACTLLGFDPVQMEQLTIEDIFDTTHSDYQKFCEELVRREKASAELVLIGKEGITIPVEISATLFEDSLGKKIEVFNFKDISERKQKEAALLESEERFRTMADGLPLIIWVHESNGNQHFVNKTFLEFFGLSSNEISDRRWHILLHPDDAEEYVNEFKACVHDRRLFHAQARVRRADGEWRWIQCWARPRFSSSGEYLGHVGTSADITEQKLGEEVLLRSEQQLRDVMDNMVALIGLLNPDGILIEANSMALKMANLTIEDVKGKPFEECYWWAWSEDVQKRLREAIRKAAAGEVIRYDEVIQVGNGKYRIIDFMLSATSENGIVKYLIPSATDITERKKAEEELQTTVEFLHLLNMSKSTKELIKKTINFIFQKTGCEAVGIRLKKGHDYPYYETHGFTKSFMFKENSLCSRDREGKICLDSSGNPVLECMCGNVICGRFNPSKPFFTANGTFWTNSTTELLAQTTESDRQARTRNRCHGEGYESVALIPLVSGDERLGLIQLNDKRKAFFSIETIQFWERLANYLSVNLSKFAAEETVRQMNVDLERRVADRTSLAEARAKQLQFLAIELIETEERERKQFAHLLHEDLQQMLAAAKMQLQVIKKRFPNEPALSDVEHILENSITKSRSLSHELSPPVLSHSGLMIALDWLCRKMKEQFDLEVELETDLEQQYENAALKIFIFRAVQELLFNVVKHAGVNRAQIVISGIDSHLSIIVKDKGRGFNKDILNKAQKGFGLLSIRERANYIGGNMTIDSTPGRGTVIKLTVPLLLSTGSEIQQQPSAFSLESQISKMPVISASEVTRVLFVDDHHVMRQGLIKLVTGLPDIEVVGEAADGQEAIDQARLLRPNVIVMDVSMPKMNGIEATRRINTEFPEIRVIGLSMFEDEHIAQTMREAGAEAFVSKTVSTAELLKAIYGTKSKNPEGLNRASN